VVSAGAGIARASETPTAVSRTRLVIARICCPRRQAGRAQQTRFDHRTKTEHPATILLPNPVAADNTERHATDRPVKIRRQINTRWGGGSRAAIAITAFRVRCIQPLAGPRWSATTTMRGKSRAGDQAHMTASGRRRPSCQSGVAPDHDSEQGRPIPSRDPAPRCHYITVCARWSSPPIL
jgi:hypothetical protein